MNVSYDDAMAFAAWRSKRDGVTIVCRPKKSGSLRRATANMRTCIPGDRSGEECGRAEGSDALRPSVRVRRERIGGA